MPDREKVIKGLELCKQNAKLCFSETECPYQCEFPRCCLKLMADGLELLKEQEHKDRMFHALEDDWKRLKELLKEQDELLKHEYWRGYNNGRADERGLQEGTIMQTFSPD